MCTGKMLLGWRSILALIISHLHCLTLLPQVSESRFPLNLNCTFSERAVRSSTSSDHFYSANPALREKCFNENVFSGSSLLFSFIRDGSSTADRKEFGRHAEHARDGSKADARHA